MNFCKDIIVAQIFLFSNLFSDVFFLTNKFFIIILMISVFFLNEPYDGAILDTLLKSFFHYLKVRFSKNC